MGGVTSTPANDAPSELALCEAGLAALRPLGHRAYTSSFFRARPCGRIRPTATARLEGRPMSGNTNQPAGTRQRTMRTWSRSSGSRVSHHSIPWWR